MFERVADPDPKKSQGSWAVVGVVLLGGILSGLTALHLENIRGTSSADFATPRSPTETRTGRVSIESYPSGAIVKVNDERIVLDNGNSARTPISSLTHMQYGHRYTIAVELEGYEPQRSTFQMDEANDGRRLVFTLRPR